LAATQLPGPFGLESDEASPERIEESFLGAGRFQ
jgi:hypothetical protein